MISYIPFLLCTMTVICAWIFEPIRQYVIPLCMLAVTAVPLCNMRSKSNNWARYYDDCKMPVLEFTTDGRILRSNKAFKTLISHHANFFHVAIPSGRYNENIALKDLIKDGAPVEITVSTRPNYVAILNTIDRYANGGFGASKKRILGFLTEVTQFKELELQFYHSQKMQAIGQLAGGIAHDFNNIMTTILGVCDMLLVRHSAADHSFVGIKQIQQNAIRAINLVKQLLAFSRKQILQPSTINLEGTIVELSNNLIRRIIGEHITLKLDLESGGWAIKADQGQFEQIIINLVVNARDAMPKGGSLVISMNRVTIKDSHPGFAENVEHLHSADAEKIRDGEYIMIKVKDNGIGIPDSDASKIFDPFYTTKPLSVGSGLGLSTVYGIVKQSGGYMYFNSILGEGTSFYILFKNAGQASFDAPIEKNLDEGLLEPMDITGKETIMVVEDEHHVRHLCVQALRQKGYTVLEAESCEMALEMFRQNSESISLIVTDIVMAGMNGSDLAMIVEKIKPEIKIVMISGYTEDNLASILKGNFLILPKPFTLKKLATVIRQALDSNKEVMVSQ